MVPKQPDNPVDAGSDPALEMRNRLLKRLAVAGGMVGLLLATLAVFDFLASPPDEPELTVYTQPVPVPPRKEISQPVIASSNLPEPPEKPLGTEVAVPPAPEIPAAPAATVSEPPAKAAEAAAPPAPVPEKARDSAPPVRSTVTRRPPEPTRPVSPPPPARIIEEGSSAPPMVVVRPPRSLAPESGTLAPDARVLKMQSPPPAPAPGGRLFSGFVLQAGVFNSVQRAEELHARLTLSGVSSTLETRVQVGPFRTRQEAEAAQARLRELGIEAVLVPPAGGRR